MMAGVLAVMKELSANSYKVEAINIVEKVAGKSMAEKIYSQGQGYQNSQGDKEEQGIFKIPPL